MGDVEFGFFMLGLLGLFIGAGYVVEAWQAKRAVKRQVHMLHERVVKALAGQVQMERNK